MDIKADYWINRHAELGESYVANRQLNNYDAQKQIVVDIVEPYMQHSNATLDFGCGVGRFQDFLWRFSDEVWALDWVPSALESVESKSPASILVQYKELPLPLPDGRFQTIWSCMVLQHIVDPERYQRTCEELQRVAQDGASFVLVENQADEAPHVAKRTPEQYANDLGFNIEHCSSMSIDKPNSHYLIVGRKWDTTTSSSQDMAAQELDSLPT